MANIAYLINKDLGQVQSQMQAEGLTAVQGEESVRTLYRYRLSFYKSAADAMASTTTTETIICEVPFDGVIKAIDYSPDAALTSNDTNYATITVGKSVAGAASVAVATITTTTTSSGSWTKWVPIKGVLTTTTANLAVTGRNVKDATVGDVLTIAIAKASSGVAVPAGTLEIFIERT